MMSDDGTCLGCAALVPKPDPTPVARQGWGSPRSAAGSDCHRQLKLFRAADLPALRALEALLIPAVQVPVDVDIASASRAVLKLPMHHTCPLRLFRRYLPVAPRHRLQYGDLKALPGPEMLVGILCHRVSSQVRPKGTTKVTKTDYLSLLRANRRTTPTAAVEDKPFLGLPAK
jgi:hypothetical protein